VVAATHPDESGSLLVALADLSSAGLFVSTIDLKTRTKNP
jgi:hypothetical protein